MYKKILYLLAPICVLGINNAAVAWDHLFFANQEPIETGPYTDEEAARFLNQATFGATKAEIQHLRQIGYDAWFEEQFNATPSSMLEYINNIASIVETQGNSYGGGAYERNKAWSYFTVAAPDQLRQRLTWALSQIFVVSEIGGNLVYGNIDGDNDTYDPEPAIVYYNVLIQNALANYRTLIENVTLDPSMGNYLSMRGNQKADPARNIRPDQNYAREILQLFSVGLNKLNSDGTYQLDSLGQPVPTYDQTTVENFARVFTGWSYVGDYNIINQRDPMIAYSQYHDTDSKTLLDGEIIPAGQTAEQDLADALDNIANHPNVGPFIATALIKQLVTSNPSANYVGRVAQAFSTSSGDLKTTIKAILLDQEARVGHLANPTTFGKLREPLLREIHLLRAMKARVQTTAYYHGGIYYNGITWLPVSLEYPSSEFGQAVIHAPSVFNFYSPFYQTPGEVKDSGLYSPEFQITTEYLINTSNNAIAYSTIGLQDNSYFNTAEELSLASDSAVLLERLDLLLMAGQMPTSMRSIILNVLNSTSATDSRLKYAAQLIMASPEYAIQK